MSIEGGIFLKGESGLELLRPQSYDSEAVLQEALADFPEVIAGIATDDDSQRALVLVAREIGIPTTGFSLDHLFLDDEGVPVLVEVKRASDTRIRREVVGQMLDYAANAATNWPVAFLRKSLEQTAAARSQSEDEFLASLIEDDDVEEFWKRVESNLAAGRIRMMFVADAIPEKLVRIIEFCNEQMNPAEVLGIEVRQYTAGDHVAYVPRIVGRTTYAVAAKQATRGVKWTRDSFFEEMDSRCSPAVRDVVRTLVDHVDRHGVKLSWGSGHAPGVGGWYDLAGRPTGCWALNLGDGTDANRTTLVLYLGDIIKHASTGFVAQFTDALGPIPALSDKLAEARAADWKKWPALALADLADHPEQVKALVQAMNVLANAGSPQLPAAPPSEAGESSLSARR